MCTAAATGREVKLTKPRISPTQIITCVLLMLTIVRLRPSFLEEWNKEPSVMADCSTGYYSCFTVCFFTVQFTRWVGDFQLSNTSSTPKIGQKGNNYCVKLQQLSCELSDFPACSTDVRFGPKADTRGGLSDDLDTRSVIAPIARNPFLAVQARLVVGA